MERSLTALYQEIGDLLENSADSINRAKEGEKIIEDAFSEEPLFDYNYNIMSDLHYDYLDGDSGTAFLERYFKEVDNTEDLEAELLEDKNKVEQYIHEVWFANRSIDNLIQTYLEIIDSINAI